jgi:PRC-barrel domain
MTARQRSFIGGLAIAVGLCVGFVGFMALAQSPQPPQQETAPAAQLIGASVFSSDGAEIGVVSAVSVADDGLITQIRVTIALPLGLGERTVPVEQGHFVPLGRGVMLDLSVEELEALPVPAGLSSTSA